MRNKKGQFIKGYTYKKPKSYWDIDWLFREYVSKQKSAEQIAKENGCNKNNILYFLQKFDIKTRSMKEIRNNKYWGLRGKRNAMFGKCGKSNPNWDGGHSPERQSKYARFAWKELAKTILKRDNYECRKCGAEHTKGIKLAVHHIKKWSAYPELRFKANNLLTLCELCHRKIHSKKK
jgi:hypothetical protein